MRETATVVSADGTKIGYRRSGSGPPLVMVHGSPATHSTFDLLVPHLEGSVTACAIDRRGRGVSDDGPVYAHAREFEDVAAVVDSFGVPVDLFGHSYGGLVALEGALLARNVRRLVVYEPWFGGYTEGLADRLQALADAGDDEAVIVSLLLDAGLSEADIDAMRGAPTWQARVSVAAVTVREVRAEDAYRFDPARFADLRVPTLVLVGSESGEAVSGPARRWAAAIPGATLQTLPGHGHTAHISAPEVLAAAILGFLGS